MSTADIAGEGEHKALDMLRHSRYTNADSDTSSVLLWSNDSDVFISLLHQSYDNVFIMTNHIQGRKGQMTKMTKCVSVNDVRKVWCSNTVERLNSSLLLAFQGNDYLPEMGDTLDIVASYRRHKELATSELTKTTKEPVAPSNANEASSEASSVKAAWNIGSGLRVIDFAALKAFMRKMTDIEITLYHTKDAYNRSIERQETLEQYSANEVQYKREYLKRVNAKLNEVYGAKRIPTYDMTSFLDIDATNPSDTELYVLEMNMALAYMKTYVWYYYYQSGYSVGSPLDHSFYPYAFPPLYSSLYILLDRCPMEMRVQFDWQTNEAIIAVPRGLDYWSKLPSYMEIQHFVTLQPNEYRLLYPEVQAIEKLYEEVVKDKVKPILKVNERPTRVARLEMYPFLPINELIAKVGHLTTRQTHEEIKIGEASKAVVVNRGRNRYMLLGDAVFPTLKQ
jgi:XRN 5'-3' exonuclease N-terminus